MYCRDCKKTDLNCECEGGPVIISLDQFEEVLKALPANRVFIFAKYKARWVGTIAEFNNGNIRYFFFNDPKNVMMSECISGVNVPAKPGELL